MTSIFSITDKVLCKDLSDAEINTAIADAAEFNKDDVIKQLQIVFSLMDGKISSIMTHLSLMVAALAFLYGSVHNIFVQDIMLLKLIYYVIALFFAVRVIFYMDYKDFEQHNRQFIMMREAKVRLRYFRIAHFMTSLGTLLFVPLICLVIIFG